MMSWVTFVISSERKQGLPAGLQKEIARVLLQDFGIDIYHDTAAKKLADDILRMSGFYAQHPTAETPWGEAWCQRAQLAYYLPLNAARLLQVSAEADKLGFFEGLVTAIDFGAGLGASAAALATRSSNEEAHRESKKIRLAELEIHPAARKLRQRLQSELDPSIEQTTVLPKAASELLVCSYSLTELQTHSSPDFLRRFDSLMIVEPSTRDDSRRLLRFRQELIDGGYHIWAPCTHQGDCPLLTKSLTDWCHDRVHFDMPEWMLKIEQQLPMKNRTLTYSYLLASRRVGPDLKNFARLTGDARGEKGKTRQMFCRGPEREFLAWLSRHGEAPKHPRGELAAIPEGEMKAHELRVQGPLDFFQPGRSEPSP